MQNKRLIVSLGLLVLLLVGAAAFIAGRMLNGRVNPLSLFGPTQNEVSLLPAKELPKTPPEAEGIFVERQDNIIVVEADPPGGDGAAGSPVGVGGGPKFEVVVTAETLIYHDTTEPPARPPSGNDPRELQQTVEAGTLENLNDSQSMVMVWGRTSGDRIIAEVLVYSDPVYLQGP